MHAKRFVSVSLLAAAFLIVVPALSRADTRMGDAPSGARVRPAPSVRVAASYDSEGVKGKKLSFTGTVSIVGNEPHASVAIRQEGRKGVWSVTPPEAAADLSRAQNRRIAFEAIAIDAGTSGDAALRVLSWKIVK